MTQKKHKPAWDCHMDRSIGVAWASQCVYRNIGSLLFMTSNLWMMMVSTVSKLAKISSLHPAVDPL